MSNYHIFACGLTSDPCDTNNSCAICRIAHDFEGKQKTRPLEMTQYQEEGEVRV